MTDERLMLELPRLGMDVDGALRRFSGKQTILLKYVRQLPNDPSHRNFCTAMEAKDYAQAESAIHMLKGVSSNLGFDEISRLANSILTDLRGGHPENTVQAVEQLDKLYTETVFSLMDILSM